AARHDIPEGVVGLVHGFEAGVELVKHPLIAAAGFTGSVRGGRALFDAAAARPVPIPFHGELGSLNPVVVTEAAATERAEAIGAGPAGAERAALPDVESPVTPGPGGEHTVSAGFLTVPAARLATEGEHDLLLEECFGPVTVVARYEDEAEVRGVLSRLPGNLTA
ncbi:aldehyde dehydrogenase (NADP(+)), partial [Streptomyces sp. 4F]